MLPGLDVGMKEGEDVVEGGQQRLAGGAGVRLLSPHHGHLLPDTQPGPPGCGPPGMEIISIRDTSAKIEQTHQCYPIYLS